MKKMHLGCLNIQNVTELWLPEGHFGNPFIFEDIINYLENGRQSTRRSKEEIFKVLMKHIEMELEEKG